MAVSSQRSVIRNLLFTANCPPTLKGGALPPEAPLQEIPIAHRLINCHIHYMIAQTDIRKLPLSEKHELLEAVWSELSADPDTIDVPQWHKDILDERQRGLQQGSIKAIDWEVAKEQINRRVR